MKNILRFLLFSLVQFICISALAQTIKPLVIGDKVPDIYFEKMLNHNLPSGKLSDFKGKAIIIDLWFHACVPCVASMPHLDSLQQEFRDDLQILPVTWESKADIQKFWKNNLNVKSLNLTQVVEDTIIRKLFPATSFPHQIWINKNGMVAAITDGKNSTRENIRKLIGTESLGLAEKKDELSSNIRWGVDPLILTQYKENKKNLLYYSYLSRYRKEFNGSITHENDTSNRLIRWKFSNMVFTKLYHVAYSNTTAATFYNGIRIERKDSSPLSSESKTSDLSNKFCYDIIYPDTTITNFGRFMIPDLDRLLGFRSREVSKMIVCYVIKPNGKGTKYRQSLSSQGEKNIYNFNLKKNKLFCTIDQVPWLVENRVNEFTDTPVLFEFKNEKSLNLKVNWDTDNLKKMNSELADYDLKIEKTKRKFRIIVLEDRID